MDIIVLLSKIEVFNFINILRSDALFVFIGPHLPHTSFRVTFAILLLLSSYENYER